jgi:hypothetical protein
LDLFIIALGLSIAILGAMLFALGIRILHADSGAYRAASKMTPNLRSAVRGELKPSQNDPGANEYALVYGLSRDIVTKKFISQAKLSEEFVDDILRR